MSKPPLEQALHHIGAILGLYWDNGKVAGNDSNGYIGIIGCVCVYVYIYILGTHDYKTPTF